MSNTQTTFNLKDYSDVIEKAAKSSYEAFERKAHAGRRQCKNTLDGCRMGFMSELAVMLYLKQLNIQATSEDLLHYANDTKLSNSEYDIIAPQGNWQVKSVRPHQYHYQLTEYHLNTYIKNNSDGIWFVEIDLINYTASIYGYADPLHIKEQAEQEENHYGALCYTAKNCSIPLKHFEHCAKLFTDSNRGINW